MTDTTHLLALAEARREERIGRMEYEQFEELLYKPLNEIREEYRRKMNTATDMVQQAAQEEDLHAVSSYSSEAERMREAFYAMNRAIKILETSDPAKHPAALRALAEEASDAG